MGVKLLWAAVTIGLLITPVVSIPAAGVVAGVLAVIGCILMWMDK